MPKPKLGANTLPNGTALTGRFEIAEIRNMNVGGHTIYEVRFKGWGCYIPWNTVLEFQP